MTIRTQWIVAVDGTLLDVAGNGTFTRIQQDLQRLPQYECVFVSTSIPKRCVSKPASCDNALSCSTSLMITRIIINSRMFCHIREQYTCIFCGTPSNTEHLCGGTVTNSYSKGYWFESRPITTQPDWVLLDLPQHLQSNSGVASRLGHKSFIPYSFDFINNSAIPFYSPSHSQSAP